MILLVLELAYFKVADRFNIIDKPNERSSHSSIVLRDGGGIIFLLSLWIWSAVFGFQYLWMNILKDVDYIYTYPKALWKYRHISGSETSNKWVMLKAVVKMYQTVLKMNIVKAWFTGLFVFLPGNILKKLKKVV